MRGRLEHISVQCRGASRRLGPGLLLGFGARKGSRWSRMQMMWRIASGWYDGHRPGYQRSSDDVLTFERTGGPPVLSLELRRTGAPSSPFGSMLLRSRPFGRIGRPFCGVSTGFRTA